MDCSQNAYNEDTSVLLERLDSLEKSLFTSGQSGLNGFQSWEKGQASQLTASTLVLNYRKRKITDVQSWAGLRLTDWDWKVSVEVITAFASDMIHCRFRGFHHERHTVEHISLGLKRFYTGYKKENPALRLSAVSFPNKTFDNIVVWHRVNLRAFMLDSMFPHNKCDGTNPPRNISCPEILIFLSALCAKFLIKTFFPFWLRKTT